MRTVFFFVVFFITIGSVSSQAPKVSVAELAATALTAPKPQIKFVELPNGIMLEYAEQGDATGIPVIFLHGYSDSWRSFELNLPFLPSTIHAFAISQRGHGNSDKPQAQYRPKDFADDVATFMDKMRIKKAVIVGHSMGSTNARHFVVTYPEKTMGLVLMGSFASFKNNPLISEFEGVVGQLEDPVDVNFVTEFQKSTIKRSIPDEYFATIISESRKLPVHVWKGVAVGWKDADYNESLKKFMAPTLIVWGDLDSYCSEKDQQSLKTVIKNSKLEVYKGTGHALHWEEPQRFANDLIEFVNTIKVSNNK